MSRTPIVLCPYCNARAELVPDSEIYGRSYGRSIYLCRPCNAYVGCHAGGKTPLGRMANAELRALKIRGHAFFDPFWKAAMKHRGWSKNKARNAAYGWLAKQMDIPLGECHFGMFGPERCTKAIGILEKQLNP